jgi:hypothetical protein
MVIRKMPVRATLKKPTRKGGVTAPPAAAILKDEKALYQMLSKAASERTVLTYSDALARFGLRFTRPSMRTMLRTVGEMDRHLREKGEPELAVLIVGKDTRLPGNGWWEGADPTGLTTFGAISREEFVANLQKKAFRFWARKSKGNDK